MARLTLALWLLALSAVVLYVFFVGLAGVSPLRLLGVTGIVAALGILFTLRSMRLAHELRSREGDPQLRIDQQRARERRGF